jgi:competence protein ComEC
VALILTLPVALYVQNRQLYRYPLTVTALDVGQGASTLFFSRGETLLVDCGGNNFSNAGDLAADQLQAMGCSRLDTLVLTHCHSDHANGVLELMARLPVSHLILPDTDRDSSLRQEILDVAAAANCQIEFLTQDTQLTLGDARFSLFAPLGDGGSNEEGLSLLCSLDGYDTLLTGDMNDTVEKRLVKYKNLPDIELLMVGHHGSSTATSEVLLLATQPDAAVISSGYNSYGHPSPEVLERLGALGCDIYRTDGMGTIIFYINGGINR